MAPVALTHPPDEPDRSFASRILPGTALAAAVGLVSVGVAAIEVRVFGHPVVEGLVVAILLGMIVRTVWSPPARLEAGVSFAAKEILEVAVLLLGASVDLHQLVRAGPSLAGGIVLLVVLGIIFSYGIGRGLGLPHKLAVLVACGNSICGNSAIAAIAPVIRADKEQVASSIAFTAILGVVVVIGLPVLITPLGLSHYQYGVLAGLTVYAVPQVLAATLPVSALSGQVGTLVKLVRVLLLGPVVLFFALMHRHDADAPRSAPTPFQITRFVPWFIIGFLILAALRSSGVLSPAAAAPLKSLSSWLTVVAMAALGLGVDLESVGKAGRPVMLTVTASLGVLVLLSISLINVLRIQ